MDLGTRELRPFHNNPLRLRYNDLLFLLNEEESVAKDGRALSHTSTITIGLAFPKNLRNSVAHLDPAKEKSSMSKFHPRTSGGRVKILGVCAAVMVPLSSSRTAEK